MAIKSKKMMLQFVVMEYVKFQQKTKTEIRYMQFHHLLDITHMESDNIIVFNVKLNMF